MKLCKMIVGFLILMTSSVSAIYAQQQITQTVTAQNKNCNATCSVIDLPELNGNPGAVVFVTPNGGSPNPHPVGAYYMYLNKWSVFNLDAAALADGAKFNIEYYPNGDSNHFVYIVSTNGQACIDHAGLNDNAGAQVRVTAHASSTIGNLWDQYPTRVDFDSSTRKWCITNINNHPISADMAFNVGFTAGTGVITSHPGQGIGPGPMPPANTNTPPACNCVIPTSLLPSGNAGGDLTGTYPDPVVKGLRGMPISIKPPVAGQVLKWNGSAWESSDDNVASSTTAPPPATDAPRSYIGTMPTSFTWASNGPSEVSLPGFSVQITLTKPSIVNISAFVPTKTIFNCGALGCSSTARSISLYRGNSQLIEAETLEGTGYYDFVIPSYSESLSPGTYTYQIHAGRVFNTLSITFNGNDMQRFKGYISVQVFPQ